LCGKFHGFIKKCTCATLPILGCTTLLIDQLHASKVFELVFKQPLDAVVIANKMYKNHWETGNHRDAIYCNAESKEIVNTALGATWISQYCGVCLM